MSQKSLAVYVTHSEHLEYIQELYHPILMVLKNQFHHFVFPNVKPTEPLAFKSLISEADFVIAEVSESSMRLGMELAMAEQMNKQLFLICKRDKKPDHSLQNLPLEIHYYENEYEMLRLIESFIESGMKL